MIFVLLIAFATSSRPKTIKVIQNQKCSNGNGYVTQYNNYNCNSRYNGNGADGICWSGYMECGSSRSEEQCWANMMAYCKNDPRCKAVQKGHGRAYPCFVDEGMAFSGYELMIPRTISTPSTYNFLGYGACRDSNGKITQHINVKDFMNQKCSNSPPWISGDNCESQQLVNSCAAKCDQNRDCREFQVLPGRGDCLLFTSDRQCDPNKFTTEYWWEVYRKKTGMYSLGQGFCSSGYYGGWDGKGIDSQGACNEVCLSESQCRYAAFWQGKTCSRYNGVFCWKNGDTRHTTYAKRTQAEEAISENEGALLSFELRGLYGYSVYMLAVIGIFGMLYTVYSMFQKNYDYTTVKEPAEL